LQWLATCTRPNISYAASYLARYLTKPTKKVWEEGIMVITYLRSTRLHAGWVDANWAGCKDTRRSTTGWIFMMNDSPITWSSKRQATVSSSTVEAEYIAMAEAAKEAQWLRGLLREIGYDQLNPTVLNCDNQGSISLARRPGTHQRTKHIDIRHHALRDLVSNKIIELEYVSTVSQRADVLMKALGGPVHSVNMSVIQVEPPKKKNIGSVYVTLDDDEIIDYDYSDFEDLGDLSGGTHTQWYQREKLYQREK
ncbi:hypothetical protein TREMEDRAFT_26072, partial [Tremella mesenterica DSM 1558]|uniref:uncharacterized protein n=1 Tax=Tremella mesenterica (strain ATCC 24925 / CBS 8224 / DSM 1558 / NBRC 9311 / NRRL Y-6157 / RJB 2259-6 / UBC 559-6) TaxID=578456 RepID=UPI0003F49350